MGSALWRTPCNIADAPTSDEMLPELKLTGHPAFERRAAFHTLNSRAMVRRYARSVGKTNKDVTVIVAHMGCVSAENILRLRSRRCLWAREEL